MSFDYLKKAQAIGDRLLASAEAQPDGSIFWGRGADRQRRLVIDSGPSSGRCGEAYFLAALSKATGDRRYRDATEKALLGIRRGLLATHSIDAEFYRLLERLRLGSAGIGGMVYVLVRLARLLEMEELLEAAWRLSHFLTPERLEEDRSLDFTWGLAGVLVSQLTLADEGFEEAMEKAQLCGDLLMTKRTLDERSGLRAWRTLRELPSTGFAHGACGIAHALLQLYRRTGEDRLYEAGLEAFAFERALYLEEIDHWEEWWGHPEDAPRFTSWCHGAPGVGLSRLEALVVLRAGDETDLVRDLQLALRATAAARTPTIDNICCGYFGRLDILLTAGNVLHNDSLVRQAHRLADLRLTRAETEGYEMPVSDQFTAFLGGFFQGEAGIGFSLLRLQDHEAFPSILSLS